MFKDKGIIFPPNLLGKNVESLMFTREFLKEKNISLEGKEAGFNFIKNYINLPLIRAEQVHGTQIKEVVKTLLEGQQETIEENSKKEKEMDFKEDKDD